MRPAGELFVFHMYKYRPGSGELHETGVMRVCSPIIIAGAGKLRVIFDMCWSLVLCIIEALLKITGEVRDVRGSS